MRVAHSYGAGALGQTGVSETSGQGHGLRPREAEMAGNRSAVTAIPQIRDSCGKKPRAGSIGLDSGHRIAGEGV